MTRWITVAQVADLPADGPTVVRVNERDIALARRAGGGAPHALDNRCPHRGGQLGDGAISGNDIVCPLHGYDFDLETGVSRYDPEERVAVYPTRVLDGAVQVDADAVPPLPTGHDGAYLGRWTRPQDDRDPAYGYLKGLQRGGPPVSAMRTSRPLRPTWDDILLLPAQLARTPLLDDEPVALGTTVGRRAARPLVLQQPFLVSHMSFGALSASAKVALARVAQSLGTAIGSGEGGMLEAERDAAGPYILEMATGYFGWSMANAQRADAVEIKFGQSAKAGSGGLLPADKVTPGIAAVRGLQPGEAAHSPSRFHDLSTAADLRARVDEIRAWLDGGPVGIKFAAGRIEDDLDVAIAAGADFVTIDGRGGGTGAAPDVLKDHLTVPIQYALHRARAHLVRRGAEHIDIVAAGNFRTGADVVKAIAMGASAVAMATAAMIAVGCQQYLACDTGNCPVGIATQRADLEGRFDVDESVRLGVATFEGIAAEIRMLCRAVGVGDVHALTTEDLVTLDGEVATHTSIRHA